MSFTQLIADAKRQIHRLEQLGYLRAAQDIRDRMAAEGYPVCEWPDEIIEDVLDAEFIG